MLNRIKHYAVMFDPRFFRPAIPTLPDAILLVPRHARFRPARCQPMREPPDHRQPPRPAQRWHSTAPLPRHQVRAMPRA